MTASPFSITPTPPTTLKLEPGQDGKFSFTVNSLAAPDNVHDVILQALLVDGEDGKGKEVNWLVVGPQRTLSISGGKTETVTITVRPTASTPRGEHTVKLAIADKDHPNDAYGYSPSVTCEVSGSPVKPKPTGMPKWLLPVLIAGGVVLVAGIVVLVVKLAADSRPSWQRIGMTAGVELDPERFGMHATMGMGKIYFGPEANTALNQYFRSFDPATGMFSGPLAMPGTAQNDFCACGFGQVLVGAGPFIWMFGNEGQRYDIATNKWTAVTTYTDTARRGEAAGALESASNSVYMIGGRSLTRTAERFSIATGVFADEPGTFPVEIDTAAAWAPPGGSLVYVAGGNGGSRKALLSHLSDSRAWTQLPDAPVELGPPLGMGDFLGRIWVATHDTLYFYNPANTTWDRKVAAPSGVKYVVGDTNGTYALVQAPGNVAEVWKLANIE